MKNKKWLWIGLGVVLVLLIIVVNVVRQAQGKITAVQFARVRVEDITSQVRAPGKIEAKLQVKISADLPGKVSHLLVKEGDRVTKGQLMLQLDDTQYRSMLDQSRAALSSGEARLREATAAEKVSDSNYERQRALFAQKLLSQAEWDQATSANESAHVAVATAHEEISRAQAAVTGAMDNVNKCRFLAPFDGVVSALNVEQGEVVITGTMNNPGTQILVVSDLSRMLVRADVDETDVVNMKLGQKAKISVDAMPDTSFQGTVIEIGNTAKRSTRVHRRGSDQFRGQGGVRRPRATSATGHDGRCRNRDRDARTPRRACRFRRSWCARSANWIEAWRNPDASARAAGLTCWLRTRTPWAARTRKSPACSWSRTARRASCRSAPASRARPRSRSSAT